MSCPCACLCDGACSMCVSIWLATKGTCLPTDHSLCEPKCPFSNVCAVHVTFICVGPSMVLKSQLASRVGAGQMKLELQF